MSNNNRLPSALQNAVTVEKNAMQLPFAWEQVKIYAHEEEHVQQKFFNHAPMNFLWEPSESTPEVSDEELVDGIIRNVRARRQGDADRNLKDEILAYYRHAGRTEIEPILQKKEADGGLYDYISDLRKLYTSSLHGVPSLLEKVDRIFGPEYEHLLEQAFDAVESLKQAGMPMPFIIEILRTEPLVRWGRFSRRICERVEFMHSKK